MMTKLLLALSAASLCALSVNAKNVKQHTEKMSRTAGKTTGTESRLKSMTYSGFDAGALVLIDSTYLSYSPNFGWDHVLKTWKFDMAMTADFDGAGYEESFRVINTFDVQKRITQELDESWTGSVWEPNSKTVYTYSAHGTIATQAYQDYDNGNWETNYKTTNNYNPSGQLTETIIETKWGPNPLGNSYRTLMGYNAQGLVETETTYMWNTTNSQWDEGNSRINYYTGNLNTLTVGGYNNSGNWISSDSTERTYDSRGNLTEELFKSRMSGGWRIENKNVYTYDANNNQTSIVEMGYDAGAFVPNKQMTTTYNTSNQPLVETYKSWDDVSNSFVFEDGDEEYRYYYEQFENSVKDATVQAGSMRVHPMPAKDKLTLNLKWNEMQNATVVLFDMTGKVAGHWTTPSATQHTQSLDISNVPSGTYMLKVMGTKGAMHQQVNIVR